MTRKESRILKPAIARPAVQVIGPMSNLVPKPLTKAQEQRPGWNEGQLVYWLESNHLDYLKDVFQATMPHQNWTRHETLNNYLSVKGGSVKHLVELLTLGKDDPLADVFEHPEFIRDWFMTYPAYCPPKEFLSALKKRLESIWEDKGTKEFDEDNAKDQTESVAHILHLWITLEDAACFANDAELYKNTLAWIDDEMKQHIPSRINGLHKLLEQTVLLRKNPPEIDLKHAPQPILPRKKEGAANLEISDMDPQEIARQMTLMESTAMRRLMTSEFQKTAWTKRNAKDIAPNLTEAIELSNRFSNWVITELLRLKSVEHMTEAIIKFVKVGKHCLKMFNFSGVLQVVTGLSNSAVNKLKACWALVPQKTKDTLAELSDLVSPLGHYKKYRDAFSDRDPSQPCLPILAATLSDLNGYEEVFASTTGDGQVNWAKMSKISGRIWDIVSLNYSYELKPVPAIQQHMRDYQLWTDNLTTCAIADLRMKEIAKAAEKKDDRRSSSKRKSGMMAPADIETSGQRDELTDKDWQLLQPGTQQARLFLKDEVVLAVGAPNDHLFRIKKGTVRVIKEINGDFLSVGTMTDGAMFGEVSMLLRSQKEGTATASIIADEDSEIYVLSVDVVMTLLSGRPALAEKLHRILAIKLALRLRDLGKSGGAAPTPITPQQLKAISSVISPKKEETEKPKKNTDPNAKFNKKFGLEGEAVFRDMECSFRSDADTTKTTHNGKLYVTPNYLCFDGGVFGFKTRETIAFSFITDLKKKTKSNVTNIIVICNIPASEGSEAQSIEYTFGQFDAVDDAFTFISSIWKHQQSMPKKEVKRSSKKPTAADSATNNTTGEEDEGASTGQVSWMPSPADWDLILKGARITYFKTDDPIVQEGEAMNRVYQLVRGECRFEKVINGQTKVLGKLGKDGNADALFGEISFLEGGKASASVVCDKDDSQIAIIEGYWLDVLFQYHPELSGRFYHYLASVLSKRLKAREAAANAAAASGASTASTSSSNNTDPSSESESAKEGKEKREKEKKKKRRDRHDKDKSTSSEPSSSREGKKERRKSEKGDKDDSDDESVANDDAPPPPPADEAPSN